MRDLGDLNITDASRGAAFTVKTVPKASKAEIVGIQEDGTIKIRLMADPLANEENEELVDFLSEFLNCDPKDIEIVGGHTTRKKLISVINIDADDVNRLFKAEAPDELLPDD